MVTTVATVTKKSLRLEYAAACHKRQELFNRLSKVEGKVGFAIWNDDRMIAIHDECTDLGNQWREAS